MSRTAWGTRVLWAAGLVTATAIAAGVWIIDSPTQQRLKRLDGARLSELQALEMAARTYWGEHDALPADLATLKAQPGMSVSTTDPSGGPDYSYRPLDATHYELCAQFDTDSANGRSPQVMNAWAHPAGKHCFRRSVEAKDSD